MRILSLDLARRFGWAVGSESGIEGYGVCELPQTPPWALGEYAIYARRVFRRMLQHVQPEYVGYEAPILMAGEAQINAKGRAFLKVRDTPAKLRKIYGLSWELEAECRRAGIKVEEADMGKVRHHFLMGPVPRKSKECKIAVQVMCRRRGWEITDDNDADALATLDYLLAVNVPAWSSRQTVLRMHAGPSDRMSPFALDAFVGSQVFFPPATRTTAPEKAENGGAGASSVSSTAPAQSSEIMAIIPPSGAATISTSSAPPVAPKWQR